MSKRNKLLFTVWVTNRWNRLPRGVLESPTTEKFKIQLDMATGHQLLQLTLLEQEVALDKLKMSFSNSTVL